MATDSEKLKSKPIKIKEEQSTNNSVINSNSIKFASFSFPRDLTLGGSGVVRNQQNVAKKVFTPNLNVTRNKKTNVKTSSSPNISSRGRGKYDKSKSNTGQGRGGSSAGGRNNNLIQTTGVFSEGVGGAIRKNSSTSVSSYSRSESSTRTNVRQGNLKATDSKSKSILSDSSDNDDNDNNDDVNAINELENVPIKLSNKDSECIVAEKNGRYNGPSKFSLNELFSKEQKKLFLMQLPDCLPHQTLTDETLKNNKDSENSSENQCFLKGLQEGQIGKLLRYKSGKYKLVLGNTFFDLELGMEPGFLQEVVSISTNQEERSGNIIDLGEIQTKINVVPDWEQLVKNNS